MNYALRFLSASPNQTYTPVTGLHAITIQRSESLYLFLSFPHPTLNFLPYKLFYD